MLICPRLHADRVETMQRVPAGGVRVNSVSIGAAIQPAGRTVQRRLGRRSAEAEITIAVDPLVPSTLVGGNTATVWPPVCLPPQVRASAPGRIINRLL